MADPVDIRYMARIWRMFGRPDLEGKQAND